MLTGRLSFGLSFGLTGGLIVGLSVGLSVVLGADLLDHITLVEAIRWKWDQCWKRTMRGSLVGLNFGLSLPNYLAYLEGGKDFELCRIRHNAEHF